MYPLSGFEIKYFLEEFEQILNYFPSCLDKKINQLTISFS